MLKSSTIPIINTKRGEKLKINDYQGKKNLCGDKIREARRKNNISQFDLAARLQIAGVILERDSISRIEIGTRFVADFELKIFAKVLEVSVEWLLSDALEPK